MNKKILVIGITLFSMFFGAGNLIFAPYLGAQAGSAAGWALAGMLVTAVMMPICAVCIISLFDSAQEMISRIWKPLGPIFMTVVYLLIGPCIAIPRTASTAAEMWSWLIEPGFMTWICIFIFFGIAAIMASHPGKLKDILGKVLGVILIGLILFLCIPLLFKPASVAAPAEAFAVHPFFKGLNEGYQTMDILAAFCFGIIITLNIRQEKIANEKKALLQASVIAGVLLAAIYSLLGLCAMRESALFQSEANGAQILSQAGNMGYGSFGRILCGLIFLIACLNVCASLLACTSEYFSELVPGLSYKAWLLLFTVAGAVVACTGLDSVLSWSGKILSFICPLAILILLVSLILYFYDKKTGNQPANAAFTKK